MYKEEVFGINVIRSTIFNTTAKTYYLDSKPYDILINLTMCFDNQNTINFSDLGFLCKSDEILVNQALNHIW